MAASRKSSAGATGGESREGVPLTNLDEPLFDGAGVTKRALVDYLDHVSDLILPELHDRPLSVIRVTGGQAPFMQKNLPKYTPDWVPRAPVWAEASHRTVAYGMANDRRTLLWFANQRAVEYHPTLTRIDAPEHPTHLVLDLDPPTGDDFARVVGAAHAVHQALSEAGLDAAVKTSGAKGIHIVVPIDLTVTMEDAAAATRALARRAELLDPKATTTAFIKADRDGKVFLDSTRAGGATVAAVYSPRARPGVPVSFPVSWDELDHVTPGEFTIVTAPERLVDRAAWSAALPVPRPLPADLVAEGREIPIARVAAMHEGKRRVAARRRDGGVDEPR